MITHINDCRKIIEKYKPMSQISDIFMAHCILEEVPINHIAELGAGAGGWAMTMNDLLDNKSIHYTLIENFKWTSAGIHQYDFPKNSQEFNKYVSSISSINFSIVEHNNPIENVDVFRIDADPLTHDIFDEYLAACNEDAIILIDDYVPNSGLYRILYSIHNAEKGNLYPIWIGDKESAWSKSYEVSQTIKRNIIFNKNKIAAVSGLKIGECNFPNINGMDWNFIRSKEGNFYGEQK